MKILMLGGLSLVILAIILIAQNRFPHSALSIPELPDLLPVGGAPANQVKGGSSPIKSSDPNRATKAKNRVTPILKKELEAKGLKFGSPIFLRIFKESHELELWVKGSDGTFDLFKNYRISAMSGKLGPKEKQGDFQAPEGFYFVNSGRFNPYSSYHLSFNIGYPNTYDRAHQRTGSLIMIHGKSVSIGCFAMTDSSIEEIYTLGDAALKNGQPFFRVHSFPFRMSKERLAAEAKSKHIDFWNNLYDGFLAFEKSKIPPNVTVRSKRYAFGKG